MCGIAGVVLGAGQSTNATTSLDSLRHRGPDGFGHTTVDLGDSRVWLGHTRLAIQDLSEAGAQPMASEDGRWLITFNGEIYNHLDLRRELKPTWRGHSDTETIVEAISVWGVEQTVKRLNGIFAFGVLDRREGKLYLARDPFGVKPLYYASTPGGFGFSSEVRSLSVVTGQRFAIDRVSLSTFFSLRFVPSPHTLLSGVSRLAPGHIVCHSVQAGTCDLTCYTAPVGTMFSGSEEEAVELYQTHVAAAVRRQLLSDVPVGVLLSGGIDSALVAAMAVNAGFAPPCFTVGYRDQTSACEIDDAAHTAKVLGLPHHVVRVDHEQLWSALQLAVASTEEPLVTTSALPMWYLCQEARKKVTVVLTGQGSDELMGGYRRYQGELIRELPLFKLVSKLARPALAWLPGISDAAERSIRSASMADVVQRFESEYCVFTAAARQRLVRSAGPGRAPEAISQWLRWAGTGRNLTAVEQMMCIDARLGLSDDLLLYGDKVSMAHSLEARVPLLDTDLANFAESMPRNFKLRLNRSKVLHKRMAHRFLPASIVHRPKKGFQVPFSDMIRGAWRERCAEALFSRSSLADLGIERSAVEELWGEHQRGFRDRSRQLFALVGLGTWVREMRGILQ